MKYYTAGIVFSEIPGEIVLEFGITNCPFKCEGCHSPFLQSDIGEPLSFEIIKKYIDDYFPALSCILISGGDRNPTEVEILFRIIKNSFPNIKTAWYSGREKLPDNIKIDNFDYIKLGPYKKDLGGLDSPTTNQRLYKVVNGELEDITHKFWK